MVMRARGGDEGGCSSAARGLDGFPQIFTSEPVPRYPFSLIAERLKTQCLRFDVSGPPRPRAVRRAHTAQHWRSRAAVSRHRRRHSRGALVRPDPAGAVPRTPAPDGRGCAHLLQDRRGECACRAVAQSSFISAHIMQGRTVYGSRAALPLCDVEWLWRVHTAVRETALPPTASAARVRPCAYDVCMAARLSARNVCMAARVGRWSARQDLWRGSAAYRCESRQASRPRRCAAASAAPVCARVPR